MFFQIIAYLQKILQYNYRKNPYTSGPVQCKTVLFKGQQYIVPDWRMVVCITISIFSRKMSHCDNWIFAYWSLQGGVGSNFHFSGRKLCYFN